MKKLRTLLGAIALCLPLAALAGYAPAKVQAALKTMYPEATDIAWSRENNYYVADFMTNGYETDVWLDTNANWVMTLTDLESTDPLSPAVYNAFAMGEYAAGQVEDVTQATFPKRPAVIVIEVGQQNMDIKYQLFYATDGTLIQAVNMGYGDGKLWPNTFNF